MLYGGKENDGDDSENAGVYGRFGGGVLGVGFDAGGGEGGVA